MSKDISNEAQKVEAERLLKTAEAADLIKTMGETMTEAFCRGESISLGLDFGTFEFRQRPAGRPIAGGKIRVYTTSNHVVVFKAAARLKRRINESEDA